MVLVRFRKTAGQRLAPLALFYCFIVFTDATVVPPLQMGAKSHHGITPYDAMMRRVERGHHPNFRHLSLDECTAVKLASGWNIDNCNSAGISIDTPVPRQLIGADGSISQWQTLAVTAVASSPRTCSCAGVKQTGNRPGTGEQFTRGALFDFREIVITTAELVMWLPPNVRCIRMGVCEQPTLAAQEAAALSQSANTYLAAIVAVQKAAQQEANPTRRLAASTPTAIEAFADEDGVLSPDTPMHPWVLAELLPRVMATNTVARMASVADNPGSDSGRAAAARGARMMDIVDPAGDLHSIGSVIGNRTLQQVIEELPYVNDATWKASKDRVGTNLGARLLWATSVAHSNEVHVANHPAHHRRLSTGAPGPGTSFITTMEEQEELQALNDPNHPFHTQLAGATSHETMHPHRKLAKRELLLAAVAMGVALAALATSITCLVVAKKLAKRIDNVENTLTAAKNSLQALNNASALLSQSIQTSTAVLKVQGDEIRNSNAAISNLQQWQSGLSENLEASTSRAAELAAACAASEAAAQKRSQDLMGAIENSTVLLNNALTLTADTNTRGLANLASTIAETNTIVMQALARLQETTDAGMAALYTQATGNQRALETMAKIFRIIVSRRSMHDTLASSVYATTLNLQDSGWRPFWSASALSADNLPQPAAHWEDGSPLRVLLVDTVLVVRTARRGPGSGSDTYAGTDAAAANSAFSRTHYAIEDSLTIMCDPVRLLMLGVLTSASADAVLGLVGPQGCVPPFTGSLAHFTGNFTGPGSRPFNPSGAPLCTCWVMHKRTSCPVVLANATSPLLTLGSAPLPPLAAPNGTQGTGVRITMLGIAGMPLPGHLAGSPTAHSPCAVTPGASPTSSVVVEFVQLVDTPPGVHAIVQNLTCSVPGGDAAGWRNVTQARAGLGIDPGDVAAPLADTYVYSLRATVGDVAQTESPATLAQTPARGIALGPNPRTNPKPNVAGSRDLCSGDPTKTNLYTWTTAATVFHRAITSAWDTVQSSIDATRVALNGKPHSDMATSNEAFSFDNATNTEVPCIYAEYAAIQDGSTLDGSRLPTLPSIPVYKVTTQSVFARGRVFMNGLPPTQPGANNAVPPYTYTTEDVLSFHRMPNSLPDTFTLVGDLEGCIRRNCTVNYVGSLFGLPSNVSTRLLYDVPSRYLGLSPQAGLTENTLGYLADRDVSKVNNTFVHDTRAFRREHWQEQHPGETYNPVAGCATVWPYMRELLPVTGPAAMSVDDVRCDPAATKADQGDTCYTLKYNGVFRPDLTGADSDLVGTPAAACGSGTTLCFIPRNSVLQVLGMEVPAGDFTVTLQAACPVPDTDLQGLGLASITVHAPKDAAQPTAWAWRFVCDGLDPSRDNVDAPGYAENAEAECGRASRAAADLADANAGGGGLAFAPGPAIPPGGSFSLDHDSYISGWTLELATTDPATGLNTVKCRSVSFKRTTRPVLGAFGDTVINYAPVVNNTAALDMLQDISTKQQGYRDATAAALTMADIKQEFMISAQLVGSKFANYTHELLQAAVETGQVRAASVEEFLNRTREVTGINAEVSAAILNNFTVIATELIDIRKNISDQEAVYGPTIASLLQANQDLANRRQELLRKLDDLQNRINEAIAIAMDRLMELNRQTEIMNNGSRSLFDDMDTALLGFAKDVGKGVVTFANGIKTLAGGWIGGIIMTIINLVIYIIAIVVAIKLASSTSISLPNLPGGFKGFIILNLGYVAVVLLVCVLVGLL